MKTPRIFCFWETWTFLIQKKSASQSLNKCSLKIIDLIKLWIIDKETKSLSKEDGDSSKMFISVKFLFYTIYPTSQKKETENTVTI